MDISTATVVGQTVRDSGVAAAFAGFLTALVKLAFLVIAGFLGRLLNTQLHVENSTWKQKLALRLVCYAEQKIADDKDKEAYVSRTLSKILGSRVAPDEIQHLLEEAVIQMQALTKGASNS